MHRHTTRQILQWDLKVALSLCKTTNQQHQKNGMSEKREYYGVIKRSNPERMARINMTCDKTAVHVFFSVAF